MDVAPERAAALSVRHGVTYYFCARTCKERFDNDPEYFVRAEGQLPTYARELYEALEALSSMFYGPRAPGSIRRDLTAGEWDAIRLVGRQGECMMRELASGCGVALSTMTGMVDRLVKKGVMERRHSETDRRVVLITLTGRGKLVYAERLDADMRLVLTMLQALQPDEQQALVSLVHKIVHSLSAAEADGSASQETQHVHATP